MSVATGIQVGFIESARKVLSILLAAGWVSLLAGIFALPSAAQTAGAGYQPAAWEKIVAAAKKEGLVRYYTTQLPAAIERTIAGFKKAYPGMAVEYYRGAAGAVMPRVDQERTAAADGADVVITTAVGWLIDRTKEGQLVAPVGPSTRNWPAEHMGRGGRYAIVGYELFIIPYNKKLMKSPPKGYADLLLPELKGKLGTIESVGSASLAAWYEWLEKTQGADYLTKLSAQNPKLFGSGAPIGQAVASGEIAAAAFATVTAVQSLMDAGAPMGFVVPDPSFASAFGLGVLPWSKRPNAALLFADYAMSVEGQTVWHGTGESAAALKNIPGSMQAGALTPYDPEAYPTERVNKYNERWKRIFK